MEIVTAAALAAWSPALKAGDPDVEAVRSAVNEYVTALPVVADLPVADDGTVAIPEAARLGAMMLAARTHRRRHSPNGIEQITGDGVAFVARYDPEISRYLGLDKPAAG